MTAIHDCATPRDKTAGLTADRCRSSVSAACASLDQVLQVHGMGVTIRLFTVVPTGRVGRVNDGRKLTPWRRVTQPLAQQPRSNPAARAHTNHHAHTDLLCCHGLLREGSWWTLWWGSLDGMQGVRGSNPLSSTRHNASAGPPITADCQQVTSRDSRITLSVDVSVDFGPASRCGSRRENGPTAGAATAAENRTIPHACWGLSRYPSRMPSAVSGHVHTPHTRDVTDGCALGVALRSHGRVHRS
jgi:hypothetical protein